MMLPLSPQMHTLTKRVDIYALYPPFCDMWLEVIFNCHAKRVDYFAISGLRTENEQKSLYQQGRVLSDSGVWVVVDASKIVTNAQAWDSAHQYGIAGDVCRDKDVERGGLQPGWRLADYEVYATECERVGLEPGMSWVTFKEGPHAQLPLRRKGLSTSRLKLAHQRGGMPEVYEQLDMFRWRR